MIPEKCRFLVYTLGIFSCYFLYGILQEKIMRGQYGQPTNDADAMMAGERFTYVLALLWIQCLCNCIFAKGILVVWTQPEDTTHMGYYATSALTYLLAGVTANMALRWVSYPTQVVGKSAKPIPVMILGVLIGRKTYSWIRYACVVAIVVGVVLFMYNEKTNESASPVVPSDKLWWGVPLLMCSLAMDGLLGAAEERIRSSYAPSGHQMMLSINMWSTLMLGVAIIFTGEAKDFVQFASRHPRVCGDVALLALCGCFGQVFIFLMVARFGALACTVVTTTRKFFNILFSVLFFGNILVPRQWFGAVLVFASLFVDMFFGNRRSENDIEYRPALRDGSEESAIFEVPDGILEHNIVPNDSSEKNPVADINAFSKSLENVNSVNKTCLQRINTI